MERAIIFDMDGVLIDSMDSHFATWSLLLKPYTSLSREEFNSWSGKSTADIFEIVKEKYRVGGRATTFARKKDKTYLEFKNKLKLFPEVKKVLAKLKELKFKLGVATSEPTIIANQLLESLGIKDYFSAIVGGETVENAKPKPDLFLLTAKLLNDTPKGTLVIEDSPTGVEAAKTAGMRVIGVTTTHPKEALSGADETINQLEELFHYLEKHKRF